MMLPSPTNHEDCQYIDAVAVPYGVNVQCAFE
jgi:hypothetical protein